MDILIRYWSEEKDQVVVRFLKSLAFGHSKAAQVAPLILGTLQEHNSLLKWLLSLLGDGPNVNKAISRMINE